MNGNTNINNEEIPKNFDALVAAAVIIEDSDYTDRADVTGKYVEVMNSKEHLRNVYAATVSSIVSRTICQPFDVLKKRMAYRYVTVKSKDAGETHRQHSVINTAQFLYAEKGTRAFWKGHSVAQLVSVAQTVTLFWTNEEFRVRLSFASLSAPHPRFCDFLAGCLSGGVVVLVSHPVEIFKIRYDAFRRIGNKHFLSGRVAKQTLLSSGWRVFFKGITPDLVHIMPLYGLKFFFYDLLCRNALQAEQLHRRTELETISLMAAGAAAGATANCIVYPLELIKLRLNLSSLHRQSYKFDSTCRTMLQCLQVIVHSGGVFGLYNGLMPCMIRSMVNMSVQFAIFDKLRDREFDFE